MELSEMTLMDWLTAAGFLVGAVLGGIILSEVAALIAGAVARRTPTPLDNAAIRYARAPARLLVPVIAVHLLIPLMPLPEPALAVLRQVVSLLFIAAVAWLIVAQTNLVVDAIAARYRIDVADNLVARQIHTQVRVLRRIVMVVVIVIAAAAMLMTFPNVRQLGASFLASAGLAGLVAGIAARPVLQNLIAGIQIALTQPVSLDDVVVINNEWGRIEEIRSTYVVVRIWDERRLIVPLNYFVENSFQNWTRTRADILATVFVYVDYTVPVEEVRQELRRILEDSPHWDRRAWALQVTDATDHSVQLRALMSAADGPKAWELRCFVRERLIEYLQTRHPQALPHLRAELKPERANGEVAARVLS